MVDSLDAHVSWNYILLQEILVSDSACHGQSCQTMDGHYILVSKEYHGRCCMIAIHKSYFGKVLLMDEFVNFS